MMGLYGLMLFVESQDRSPNIRPISPILMESFLKAVFLAKNNKLYVFVEDILYLGFVVSGIFSKFRIAIEKFFRKESSAFITL